MPIPEEEEVLNLDTFFPFPRHAKVERECDLAVLMGILRFLGENRDGHFTIVTNENDGLYQLLLRLGAPDDKRANLVSSNITCSMEVLHAERYPAFVTERNNDEFETIPDALEWYANGLGTTPHYWCEKAYIELLGIDDIFGHGIQRDYLRCCMHPRQSMWAWCKPFPTKLGMEGCQERVTEMLCQLEFESNRRLREAGCHKKFLTRIQGNRQRNL